MRIRLDTLGGGALDWQRVREVVSIHDDALAQAFKETFTRASVSRLHAARGVLVARQLNVLQAMMDELPAEVQRCSALAWPTAKSEHWSVLPTKLREELAWWLKVLAGEPPPPAP